MVGETINNTEAVWLNNVKDHGASVDIEGMALSADAVANLISNLRRRDIQGTSKSRKLFRTRGQGHAGIQFTLTCEKAKS